MMLVVGGAHSGKRTFVREKLGFAADDFVDAAQLAEGGGGIPRLLPVVSRTVLRKSYARSTLIWRSSG